MNNLQPTPVFKRAAFYKRIVMAAAVMAGLNTSAQCTYTAAITTNGSTSGCGSRVLSIAPTGDTWTQKADFAGTDRQSAVGLQRWQQRLHWHR